MVVSRFRSVCEPIHRSRLRVSVLVEIRRFLVPSAIVALDSFFVGVVLDFVFGRDLLSLRYQVSLDETLTSLFYYG